MVAPLGMVLILALAGAVGCLFSRRARPFALGVLGIAVLGMLFARVSERPTPLPADWAYPIDAQRSQIQNQAALQQTEQFEILRNQRMAAQMDDAFVQISPDGSTLETYPDGMQVRQRGSDGFRSIVRSANGGGWSGSYSTHSEIRLWILGAPLLALIVAFIVLKRAKRGGGSGKGWAVAGFAAMLLMGGTFWGSSNRYAEVTEPMPQLISPRESRSPTNNVWSGSDAQISKTPLDVQRVQQDVAKVFQEVYSRGDGVIPQESIETIWSKLTQPKINLDPPAGVEVEETKRELANAAKVILSATAPAADPFTQGWLINAARAITTATPKAGTAEADGVTSVAEAPPVALTDKPRPDWIDNPPKRAGDTRRVVVSTEALKTIQECHVHLEKRLRFAVADRVRELARQATGRSVVNSPMLVDMGISPDYILRELCPEGTYVETVNNSTGELKRAHALIEFTPQKDTMLLQRWQSAMRAQGAGPADVGPAAAEAAPRARSYTTGERPEWVDRPPKLVGNTRRVVVSTDPFVTVQECYVQLQDKLRNIVQGRVQELASAAHGGRRGVSTPRLELMGVSIGYVLSELCPEDDYVETLDTSVGEMKRAHALLEFNEAQDQYLLSRWRDYARVERIEMVSGAAAFAVAVVGFVFGLLKVDTWTRGYYTKRLFLGVPAAIIAVVALLLTV